MTQPTLELYGDQRPTLHRPRVAAAAMILYAFKSLLYVAVVALSIVMNKTDLGAEHQALLHRVYGGADFADGLIDLAALLLLAIANLGKPAAPPWPLILLISVGLAANLMLNATRIFYNASYDLANPSGMSLSRWHAYYILDFVASVFSALLNVAWIIYASQIARLLRSAALFVATAIVAGLCLLVEVPVFFLDVFGYAIRSDWDVSAWYAINDVVGNITTYGAIVVSSLMLLYFAILAFRLLRPRIH